MLVVGKEFDADERAEVGGGLRGFEGDDDKRAVGISRLSVPLRENGL
jgi:hypothetical protein